MTSSWLIGTKADTTPKPPLSQVQRQRVKRKQYHKKKRNAIIQAKKKGKPVGRAIRAFELREKNKERYRNL